MAEKKTTTKKTVKKNVPAKKTTKKIIRKITHKKTVKKKVVKKAASPYTKQGNLVEKPSDMGLFSRFLLVFTPSFLEKLGNQKFQGKSWGFWFLSNFFFIFILGIAFFISQSIFFADFPNNLIDKIPDNQKIQLDSGELYNVKKIIRNFELSLNSEGKLSSQNIPDPLIFVANEGKEMGFKAYTELNQVNEKSAEFVFIIDTKNSLELKNSKKHFENFIYILSDEAIFYDGRKNKSQTIIYKEIISEFENSTFPKTLDYNYLIQSKPFFVNFAISVFGTLMFILYFFLTIIRLINAVFWALVFWAIGAVFNIKNWDFEKSFIAMLHFSFITMLFLPMAFILDVKVFWYSFIVFGLLFGMNFWHIKNKSK